MDKNIKYLNNEIKLIKNVKPNEEVLVYVQPDKNIDLSLIDINNTKVILENNDILLKMNNGGSLRLVSLGLFFFNEDEIKLKFSNNKEITSNDLKSYIEVVNEVDEDKIITSEQITTYKSLSEEHAIEETAKSSKKDILDKKYTDINPEINIKTNDAEEIEITHNPVVAEINNPKIDKTPFTTNIIEEKIPVTLKTEDKTNDGTPTNLTFDIDIQHIRLTSEKVENIFEVTGGGGMNYLNEYPIPQTPAELSKQGAEEIIDYSYLQSTDYDKLIINAENDRYINENETSRMVEISYSQPPGFDMTKIWVSGLPEGVRLDNGIEVEEGKWELSKNNYDQKDYVTDKEVDGFYFNEETGKIEIILIYDSDLVDDFEMDVKMRTEWSLDNFPEGTDESLMIEPIFTELETEMKYGVNIKETNPENELSYKYYKVEDVDPESETGFFENGFVISTEINGNYIKGGHLRNEITGSFVNDEIIVFEGDDLINAGKGDDIIHGSLGNDEIHGEEGEDTIDFSNFERISLGVEGIEVNLDENYIKGSGEDYIDGVENVIGTDFKDKIKGDEKNNTLYGGANTDIIDGLDGDDKLYGGLGDDFLYGGLGTDVLYGGDGKDTVDYSKANQGMNIKLQTKEFADSGIKGGRATIISNIEVEDETDPNYELRENEYKNADEGIDYLYDIENVYGTEYDDLIAGDSGDNILDGKGGIDSIDYSEFWLNAINIDLGKNLLTGDGIDYLYNFENIKGTDVITFSDTLVGNDSDNIIYGLKGDDILDGGKGDDFVYGGDGDDIIYIDDGNDTYDGGNGSDTIDFSKISENPIYINLNDNSINTEDNIKPIIESDITIIDIENIVGTKNNDVMIGNQYSNALYGNDGNDILYSYGSDMGDDISDQGYDIIDGGAGLDTISFDYITDETKSITLDLSLTDYIQSVGDGKLKIYNLENIIGGIGDDVFSGNLSSNILKGEEGDDYLIGLEGDDYLYGGNGSDVLDGGIGNDYLDGGDGYDILSFYKNYKNGVSIDTSKEQAILDDGFGTQDIILNFEEITGSSFDDLFKGSDTIDDIFNGGFGNDKIYTSIGNDILNGDLGDDIFYITNGTEITEDKKGLLDGGAGNNIVSFLNYDKKDSNGDNIGVNIELSINNDTNSTILIESDKEIIETIKINNIVGSNYDDEIKGNDLDNTLDGGDGNDIFYTSKGKDYINGNDGIDELDLFDMNNAINLNLLQNKFYDNLTVKNGDSGIENYIYNVEKFSLTDYDDFIELNSDYNIVDGKDGIDMLSYENYIYNVNVDLLNTNKQIIHEFNDGEKDYDEIKNIENLTGSNFKDILKGDNNTNYIYGGNESDEIYGNDGNDYLYGELDNDKIYGGNGIDIIYGGDGDDIIYANTTLNEDDDRNELYGEKGNDTIYGSNNNDIIDGGFGADIIYGGDGENELYGDLGDDIIYGGEDIDNIYGGFDNDKIYGYEGADNIYGDDGDDEIYGGDGDDNLNGGNGNDNIYGDEGDDTLNGGDGDDNFIFEIGSDNYIGGNGIDIIDLSNSGDDIAIYINLKNNLIEYNSDDSSKIIPESDTITTIENVIGTNYNDVFEGDSSNNIFDAGNGIDTISFENATNNIKINLSITDIQDTKEGDDIFLNFENIIGGEANDELIGDKFNNKIDGNLGNDVIDGGDGADEIYGGDGDDKILMNKLDNGEDVIDGGDGDNTLSFENIEEQIVDEEGFNGINIDFNQTEDTDGFIEIEIKDETNKLKNIENYIASNYDDKITGSKEDNYIYGLQGNDYISGGEGNDLIDGGDGEDTLNFDYAGSNSVVVNFKDNTAKIDSLSESNEFFNIENVKTFDGTDEFIMLDNDTKNSIDGGNSIDIVNYINYNSGIIIDLSKTDYQEIKIGSNDKDKIINIENIKGSNFDDNLKGNDEDNIIYGEDGVDTIETTNGNDELYGGIGSDDFIINFNDGEDLLDGGDDVDTLDLSNYNNDYSLDVVLNGNTESDLSLTKEDITAIDKIKNIENIIGTQGNDKITGDYLSNNLQGFDGNDTIDGSDGHDYIYGDLGDDKLYGGTGNDTIYGFNNNIINEEYDGKDIIYGGAGSDTIYGGYGDDEVYGGTEGDEIYGDEGNDILNGEDGDDTIYGGDGNDNIYGGEGSDILNGDVGDDIFYSEDGNDTYDGGDGKDSLSFELMTEGINLDLSNTGKQDIDGGTTIENIEVIIGTNYDDTFKSNIDIDNIIYGGKFTSNTDGDIGEVNENDGDTMDYSNLNDEIDDKTEEYIVANLSSVKVENTKLGDIEAFNVKSKYINDDNDEIIRTDEIYFMENIIASSGNDYIIGSDDNDVIYGEDGDDDLSGGLGENIIYGGDGSDNINYSNVEIALDINLNDKIVAITEDLTKMGIDTVYEIENVIGTNNNDLIIGDASDNILNGNDGEDILNLSKLIYTDTENTKIQTYTNLGNNELKKYVGDGDDNTSDDKIGIDTLISIENVEGSAAGDYIIGDDNNNVLNGNKGNDVFEVSKGEDIINGGEDNDLIDFSNLTNNYIEINLDNENLIDLNIYNLEDDTKDNDYLTKIKLIENIIGTNNNDIISGDKSNNNLIGLKGDDYINGEYGEDYINGGDGNDNIYGDYGLDTIYGENGNDYINAGEGNDLLYGGEDNDVIAVGAGEDIVDGENGYDIIDFSLSSSNMNIDLNNKDDDGYYTNINSDVETDQGVNKFINIEGVFGSNTSIDKIILEEDNINSFDILTLSNDDIITTNNSKDNKLILGTGDDLVIITDYKTNDDYINIIDGDIGIDTINYSNITNKLFIDFTSTTTTTNIDLSDLNSIYAKNYELNNLIQVQTQDNDDNYHNVEQITNIENIIGTNQNDTIKDYQGEVEELILNNNYQFLDGDDNFIAGFGNDIVDMGVGIDTIDYSNITDSNNELFINVDVRTSDITINYLNEDNNKIELYKQNIINYEKIIGSMNNDVFNNDNFETGINQTFDGNDGIDTISVLDYLDNVYINLEEGKLQTIHGEEDSEDNGETDDENDILINIENIKGGFGEDILIGDNGTNIIDGGASADFIKGGLGNDKLYGSLGDDIFEFIDVTDESGNNDNDIIDGGADYDIVDYSKFGSDYHLEIDMTKEGDEGKLQIIKVIGEDDRITDETDDKLVKLDTLLNIESIIGTSQNDIMIGDGMDVLIGGAGDDYIKGNIDDDDKTVNLNILHGGLGNDIIYGSSDKDEIYGEEDNDIIYGSAGIDIIDGGDGIDEINYNEATDLVIVDLYKQVSSGNSINADILTNIENVTGSDYADIIKGNLLTNIINGGDGNDYIIATIGNGTEIDIYNGGNDIDLVDYTEMVDENGDTLNKGIYIDFNLLDENGYTDVRWNEEDGDVFNKIINVESVITSNQNDYIITNNSDNSIRTAGGNDYIQASLGNDKIDGGVDNDLLDFSYINDSDNDGEDDLDYGLNINLNAVKTTINNVDFFGYGYTLIDSDDETTNYGIDTDGDVDGDGNILENWEKAQAISIENIIGTTQDDIIILSEFENIIQGAEGDDLVYVKGINNIVYAGYKNNDDDNGNSNSINDTIDFSLTIDGIKIDLNSETDLIEVLKLKDDTVLNKISGFSNIVTTNMADVITIGNEVSNDDNMKDKNVYIDLMDNNDILNLYHTDDTVIKTFNGGMGIDIFNTLSEGQVIADLRFELNNDQSVKEWGKITSYNDYTNETDGLIKIASFEEFHTYDGNYNDELTIGLSENKKIFTYDGDDIIYSNGLVDDEINMGDGDVDLFDISSSQVQLNIIIGLEGTDEKTKGRNISIYGVDENDENLDRSDVVYNTEYLKLGDEGNIIVSNDTTTADDVDDDGTDFTDGDYVTNIISGSGDDKLLLKNLSTIFDAGDGYDIVELTYASNSVNDKEILDIKEIDGEIFTYISGYDEDSNSIKRAYDEKNNTYTYFKNVEEIRDVDGDDQEVTIDISKDIKIDLTNGLGKILTKQEATKHEFLFGDNINDELTIEGDYSIDGKELNVKNVNKIFMTNSNVSLGGNTEDTFTIQDKFELNVNNIDQLGDNVDFYYSGDKNYSNYLHVKNSITDVNDLKSNFHANEDDKTIIYDLVVDNIDDDGNKDQSSNFNLTDLFKTLNNGYIDGLTDDNSQVYIKGNGDQTITVESEHNFYTYDGNDNITLKDGVIDSNIHVGNGTNTINIEAGHTDIYSGSGIDTFNISGGSGTDIWGAGSGDDIFNITGGSDTYIRANDGKDIFNIKYDNSDYKHGDNGNDIFKLDQNTILNNNNYYGDDGDDTFYVSTNDDGNRVLSDNWENNDFEYFGENIEKFYISNDDNIDISLSRMDNNFENWIDGDRDTTTDDDGNENGGDSSTIELTLYATSGKTLTFDYTDDESNVQHFSSSSSDTTIESYYGTVHIDFI